MLNSQPKNLIAETYNVDASSTRMNNPYMPAQGNMQMQPNMMQNMSQPYAQPYSQPYGQPYAQPPVLFQAPMTTTTIINTGTTYARPTWRTHQNVMCSNCQTSMVTAIDYTPGGGTVILCLALGVCIGVFAFISCFLDDCKDCNHYCSRCGAHVGTVRYMFDD